MRFIINGCPHETHYRVHSNVDQIVLNLDGIEEANFELIGYENAALDFFDSATGNPALHDTFFQNFSAIAEGVFFEDRHWHRAEHLMKFVVKPALAWEQQNPEMFIHKGTPFYYWGGAAILRGGLDTGYALMHQALQEDIRTQGNQHPVSPATAFARLEYNNRRQAFFIWLQTLAEFLQSLLVTYHSSRSRNLQLGDFRQRFLENPPNWDTEFLFGYVLGRMFILDRVPIYALQSNFSAQLQANLLFDLALVIDAAIYDRNPSEWKFSMHAMFLSQTANLNLTQDKLQGELNRAFEQDFQSTLVDVLDGRFRFQDGSDLTGPETDLAITYKLRNYAAHNVVSVPVIWQRFQDIRQCLFNTLFLVVESLY